MAEEIKLEFEAFIRELSTEICKEVLLDELKKIHGSFRETAVSYETLTRAFDAQLNTVKTELASFGKETGHITSAVAALDRDSQSVKEALSYVKEGNDRAMEQIGGRYDALFQTYQDEIRALNEQERVALLSELRVGLADAGEAYVSRLQDASSLFREQQSALAGELRSVLSTFSAQYATQLMEALEAKEISSLPQNLADIATFFRDLQGEKERLIKEAEELCEKVLDKNIRISSLNLTKTSVQVAGVASEIKQSAESIQDALKTFSETEQLVGAQTRSIQEALEVFRNSGREVLESYEKQLSVIGQRENASLLQSFQNSISATYRDTATLIQNSLDLGDARRLTDQLLDACKRMKDHEQADHLLVERLKDTEKAMSKMQNDLEQVSRQYRVFVSGTKLSLDNLAEQAHQQEELLTRLAEDVLQPPLPPEEPKRKFPWNLALLGGIFIQAAAILALLLMKG